MICGIIYFNGSWMNFKICFENVNMRMSLFGMRKFYMWMSCLCWKE